MIEARVVPVILRACDWQCAPFGKLQGLPKDVAARITENSADALLSAGGISPGKRQLFDYKFAETAIPAPLSAIAKWSQRANFYHTNLCPAGVQRCLQFLMTNPIPRRAVGPTCVATVNYDEHVRFHGLIKQTSAAPAGSMKRRFLFWRNSAMPILPIPTHP